MNRHIYLQTLGLILFGSCLWAQQAEVSGFIRDPAGAVVTNAVVSIQNSATNVQQNTRTNDAGVYTLQLLRSGVYQLTIEAPGFKKKTIEGIQTRSSGEDHAECRSGPGRYRAVGDG